jgi:hypothetical protein
MSKQLKMIGRKYPVSQDQPSKTSNVPNLGGTKVILHASKVLMHGSSKLRKELRQNHSGSQRIAACSCTALGKITRSGGG